MGAGCARLADGLPLHERTPLHFAAPLGSRAGARRLPAAAAEGGARQASADILTGTFSVALPAAWGALAGLRRQGATARRAGRRGRGTPPTTARPAPTAGTGRNGKRRPSSSAPGRRRGSQSGFGSEAQRPQRRPAQKQDAVPGRLTSASREDSVAEVFEDDGSYLAQMNDEEEQNIWTSNDVLNHLDEFRRPNTVLCQEGKELYNLLQAAVNGYSKEVTRQQLALISQTLVESELVSPDRYTLEVTAAGTLEEPLSWRPLANDLGLRAFGLDLYLWRLVHEPARGRGFSASKQQWPHSTDELEAIPDAHGVYRWGIIGSILLQFSLDFNFFRSPRLVCSRRMATSLEDPELRRIAENADFDIVSYPGSLPSARHLVSDAHSAVILVLEEPVLQPSDAAWSLPVEEGPRGAELEADLCIKDLNDCAPIVVVSLMQHSVEMSFNTCLKRAAPVLEMILAEALVEKKDTILNSFLQPFFSGGNEDSVALQVATEHLRERVGPLIRQAYASSFAQLRRKRLQGLAKAKEAWQARESQRKERQAKRQAALRSLEEAALEMDPSLFAMRAKKAAAEGGLVEEDWRELEAKMYADLEAMEAPLKRLVAMHCQGADGRPATPALHDLSTDELDELLARPRPPEGNAWRRACQELRAALCSLAVLRTEALGVDFYKHSSAASLKAAVLRANAELLQGEAALVRFESFARAAAAPLTPGAAGRGPGAAPLRRLLEDCKATVAAAGRDEALWACLTSAPWSTRPLDLGQVTAGRMAELQSRGAAASGPLLSHLGDSLQAALDGGRCAVALQKALEGSGDSQALEKLLLEAKELGLSGLEPAEQLLSERRANDKTLSALRSSASQALQALDLELLEEQLEAARSQGLALPEEGELRSQLEREIAEAEAALREALLAAVDDLQCTPAAAKRLQLALEASRLPAENPWRAAAEAGSCALEVAASIREAAAVAGAAAREEPLVEGSEPPSAAEGLEALNEALALVPQAASLLEETSRSVGEERLAAAAVLRKAQEEGEVALKGLQADEALRERLESAPWNLRPLPLGAAAEGDVEELKLLAEGATIGGLHRAAAALDAACAAGACARRLQEALEKKDQKLLKEMLLEAQSLSLSDLEPAQRLLSKLEVLEEQQRREAELAEQRRRQEAEAEAELAEQQRRQDAEAEAARRLPVAADSGRDDRWSEGVESSNLIFLDLELTAGFYEFDEKPRVLEAAIVVTDKDLNEKGRGTWVIGDFSREELEALGDFHQAHFRDTFTGGPFPPRADLGGYGNGLFADVLASCLKREDAEEQMLALVREHCPPGACPLSGYSVQCDREVLKLEMPRLFRYVSHQIVDVSSFLRMARLCSPERVSMWDRRASRYNHRALNDVEDSIDALRWVQEEFFRPRARR